MERRSLTQENKTEMPRYKVTFTSTIGNTNEEDIVSSTNAYSAIRKFEEKYMWNINYGEIEIIGINKI